MSALAAVLDPDCFVIGGGVVSIGDILLEPARYNYVRFLQAAAYRPHAEILAAGAGNDAGMVGAADLALREAKARKADADSSAKSDVKSDAE
jgi:glucokinase